MKRLTNKNKGAFLAFTAEWFHAHQERILGYLNHPKLRRISRWLLAINPHDIPLSEDINEVAPHYFGYSYEIIPLVSKRFLEVHGVDARINLRAEAKKAGIDWVFRYKRDYRTHQKYAKAMYYALRPVWWAMHAWDLFADALYPRLSFGFSTLTAYPDANPETNTCDGWIRYLSAASSWSAIRDTLSGNGIDDTSDTGWHAFLSGNFGSPTNDYEQMRRGHTGFNTAGVDDTATVNSAVLSFYINLKQDALPTAQSVGITTDSPASNTGLGGGDYDSFGSTRLATDRTIASLSTSTYQDWTFNSDGKAAINKTGVTNLMARLSCDIDNSAPGSTADEAAGINIYYAEDTSGSKDPKLVVDYSTTSIKTVKGLAYGSVKTVKGLAVASMKTWNGLT